MTPTEHIAAGGWVECMECSMRLDEYLRCDLMVERGDWLFCDSACHAVHACRVAKQNQRAAEFEAEVRALRPDLDWQSFSGQWPIITVSGHFKFPDVRFGGGWVRRDYVVDAFQWFVAQGDLDAWNAYEDARKALTKAKQPTPEDSQ